MPSYSPFAHCVTTTRDNALDRLLLARVDANARTLVDIEFEKLMIEARIGLDAELTLMDWFCGAGGSSQGAHAVPGIRVARAANHWEQAIETHRYNFPEASHWRGDLSDVKNKEKIARWPICTIFWASPECPQWTAANGKRQDYRNSLQNPLFAREVSESEQEQRDADDRSRALMEEVPQYLAGVMARGGRVLAGVVENVIDVRGWDQWDRWRGEFHTMGYRTRLIALNSMHAQAPLTPLAPQSRDRLYLAYWASELGRDPDWDKWLRPLAHCPVHGRIQAVQTFKRSGNDMGRYRSQYIYRCPRVECRNAVVEPPVVPAAAAIDWSDLGRPIGERRWRGRPGLAPTTMARVAAGLERYRMPPEPCIVPTGGTWRTDPSPVTAPLPARTTRENDGIAIPPFLALLRSDRPRTIAVTEPLATVVTDGSGHALVSPTAMSAAQVEAMLTTILVPYNRTGTALRAVDPVGAIPTRDRWSMVQPDHDVDLLEVLFRMLTPAELSNAMAFTLGYTVLGKTNSIKIRQYGNAVTPPAAEVLLNALVEAISGTELERWPAGCPFPDTLAA